MKTHDQFIADLQSSRQIVNDLALAAQEQGFEMLIKPSSTAPDKASRMQHVDKGDAVLIGHVELKHRPDLSFTCRADYPYPTVMVDERYKVTDPVLQYIIVNGPRTHAAVVYGWTRKHWVIESKYDRKAGRQAEFWCCPPQLVRFCAVEDLWWTA